MRQNLFKKLYVRGIKHLLGPLTRHLDILMTYYLLKSDSSVSYLDILLEKDANGYLTTKLYDKQYDFNFSIVNFLYLCSTLYTIITC